MAHELLPGPHSGVKTTLTKGDPLSRSMGHYGKGHSFNVPAMPAMGAGAGAGAGSGATAMPAAAPPGLGVGAGKPGAFG